MARPLCHPIGRPILLALALLATSAGAAAQQVALSGVLGAKALLVINGGTPRSLAAGQSHEGVKVLSVTADSAVIEVAGQRQTVVLGAAPVSVRAGGVQRLTLQSDERGHFIQSGFINGRSMRYLVDTGATVVAIGQPEADRLGLRYQQGQPAQMSTANGVATGWRITLETLRVGDIELRQVDAVVMPLAMPYVLLGNNFLGRFEMTRSRNELVLELRH